MTFDEYETMSSTFCFLSSFFLSSELILLLLFFCPLVGHIPSHLCILPISPLSSLTITTLASSAVIIGVIRRCARKNEMKKRKSNTNKTKTKTRKRLCPPHFYLRSYTCLPCKSAVGSDVLCLLVIAWSSLEFAKDDDWSALKSAD